MRTLKMDASCKINQHKIIIPRVIHSGVSIMSWGCFFILKGKGISVYRGALQDRVRVAACQLSPANWLHKKNIRLFGEVFKT
uniref:Uncharacterized protein n=1 Tax=Salarias fasciatus TaxID=181472 RepID=A0A672HSM9_SALFA